MGRPRKYATNAERQSAYRDRKKPAPKKVGLSLPNTVFEAVIAKLPAKCQAYAPQGTKCKFCGKSHA